MESSVQDLQPDPLDIWFAEQDSTSILTSIDFDPKSAAQVIHKISEINEFYSEEIQELQHFSLNMLLILITKYNAPIFLLLNDPNNAKSLIIASQYQKDLIEQILEQGVTLFAQDRTNLMITNLINLYSNLTDKEIPQYDSDNYNAFIDMYTTLQAQYQQVTYTDIPTEKGIEDHINRLYRCMESFDMTKMNRLEQLYILGVHDATIETLTIPVYIKTIIK